MPGLRGGEGNSPIYRDSVGAEGGGGGRVRAGPGRAPLAPVPPPAQSSAPPPSAPKRLSAYPSSSPSERSARGGGVEWVKEVCDRIATHEYGLRFS